MNQSPESIKEQILDFLKHQRFDQTIKAIAGHIKRSRLTTSKYLQVLVAENRIVSRQEGNTLLYSISRNDKGGF